MTIRRLTATASALLWICSATFAQNTVFLETFSTDGDGVRYDMFGRGSDTSPDAWEHTFAAAQSTTFPIGPGGTFTIDSPRIAIPWHSTLDSAADASLPIIDEALSWATGGGSGLNVSFLVKDGPTSTNLDPGDAILFSRLTNDLSHTVTLFDAATVTPDAVAASDLLLISDSLNLSEIYKSISVREATVPVVNYNPALGDDLLLTVTEGSVQQLQEIDITTSGGAALPSGLTQGQTIGIGEARGAMPEYGPARDGTQVLATYRGPFARNVSNLATVDAMIGGQAGSTTEVGVFTEADFSDATDPAAGIWNFDHEIPGSGGNDYAIVARGSIAVSEAGDYVFGVGGDDGGRLRINGEDVIVDDATHGFRYATGSVNLPEGDHQIEWVGFERGGGAGFELSFAPANVFTGTITADDADVISTEPFFEEIRLNEPGLEVTTHYLDVDNSPDVETNNPAIIAAPAGTTFNLPSTPFRGAVGDYLIATDMDGIPDTSGVPPGLIEFKPIDLSGVADPKLTLNVAGTFGMEEEGSFTEGVVVFVNDEEVASILPNEAQILVDSQSGKFVGPTFQSLTYDLPAGLSEANIRIEVGNNSSGETIGIDEVRITDGMPDPSDLVTVPESLENRIQQGANGYQGLEDTEIRLSQPDADLSAKLFLNPDGEDGGGEVHALTRFNDIIGDGENQIPADANVESATLNINITGPGTPLSLHRMLQAWEDETATWNAFENGIQADDVEAKQVADDVQTANTGITSWDITESIKAWQEDPESNFGWVMLPNGTNGVDYLSAEAFELETGGLQLAPYIEFFLGASGPELIPGDVDGNGSVEFADFLLLSANFDSEGTREQGDLDGDGIVAFADFLILSANFGNTAAEAIPEPTAAQLLLSAMLAGVGLLRRRRAVVLG